MNPIYFILIFLSAMVFIDFKFYRILAYCVIFNFIVALISLQTEPVTGTVLFLFGCILMPLLMWFAIEHSEKEEREPVRHMIAVAAICIPALIIFFGMIGITTDHNLLFTLFSFSLISILTSKNLLKFLFIFDIAKNILILTALSFFTARTFENLAIVLFIEITTFLPFVLLVYLTIHIYKKYRSLNPWHLWQSH